MKNKNTADDDDDEHYFCSDQEIDDDDEQIFWSDEETEEEPFMEIKCKGCSHSYCDEFMPMIGIVLVGSRKSLHVLDYLLFSERIIG